MSFNRYAVFMLATGAALTPGHTRAAAFQLKENSAKSQGRAFAGSASAPGDTALVATNPAGMRLLDGRQFQFGAAGIGFSAEYRGDGGRHAGLGGAGTGMPVSGGDGGNAGKVAAIPSAYLHLPFGENDQLHFGASLTVPFGLETEYDRDWVGRYNGTGTKLQAIDAGLALSYDVNPYVSFGVNVFVERLDVKVASDMDLGAVLAGAGVPGFVPGNADAHTRVEGDNTDVGFVLGGLFSLDENTHIGLTYRSGMQHKISGGSARFDADTPTGAAALGLLRSRGLFVDSAGRATLELPAVATVSVTHRINDKWTVMADLSRTGWSKFDQVVVRLDSGQSLPLDFGYEDTTFGSVGADYRVSDTLTLRGGLAYDQTPTTAAHRDTRVPDATRKLVSLGLTWTPSPKTEYNLGYTHAFASDPKIDLVTDYGSTLAGSYDLQADVLAGSFTYRF